MYIGLVCCNYNFFSNVEVEFSIGFYLLMISIIEVMIYFFFLVLKGQRMLCFIKNVDMIYKDNLQFDGIKCNVYFV